MYYTHLKYGMSLCDSLYHNGVVVQAVTHLNQIIPRGNKYCKSAPFHEMFIFTITCKQEQSSFRKDIPLYLCPAKLQLELSVKCDLYPPHKNTI